MQVITTFILEGEASVCNNKDLAVYKMSCLPPLLFISKLIYISAQIRYDVVF